MYDRTTPTIALARRLAQELASRADAADREGKLPLEDIQALREAGYFALSVPRGCGGPGRSLGECVAAHLELAQGSASTALVAAMPLHVFGHAREILPWTEAMFTHCCQAALDGALFNNVASEPQLGSPSRGGLPQTSATPQSQGQGWIVNGHKTWTSGGQHITHMLVRLRVGDDPGLMLVPQGAPGVSWQETWQDALSLRASDSHDVYFSQVEVPYDYLLERGAKQGKPLPNAWFPLLMAATYLGAALAARQAVIRFALERVPTALGKPIATLPRIQRQVGEMDVALQAAQALLLDVAYAWNGEAACHALYPRVVAAKHMATEVANEVTDKALRLAGGQSLTRGLPLERYFRDVRAAFMQPPSGDTALEMVGRWALDSAL